MLRIGQVESSATTDGKYTDGNVAGGIAATRLRAAAFNAIQEELAHIVESTGTVLDENDTTQVLVALHKIFAGNSDALGALAALTGDIDKLPYFTGPDTAKLTALTAFARQILAQTDAAGVLSKLGISSRSLVITSSQTVTTLPSWVTDIWVSGCAGGGGGASGATNNGGQSSLVGGGGGGGGGAGQSVIRKKYTITAGQSLVVTIGSGGNGAAASSAGGGNNGGSGGSTSITGLFTLAGGTGGYAGGAVTANSAGNGGAGGYGGEGYPAGGSGGDGNYAGSGGSGGSTAFGGGGGGARAVKSNPTDSHLLGHPADGYGSGGGGSGGGYGSASAVNSFAAGNGAPGIVIIEW